MAETRTLEGNNVLNSALLRRDSEERHPFISLWSLFVKIFHPETFVAVSQILSLIATIDPNKDVPPERRPMIREAFVPLLQLLADLKLSASMITARKVLQALDVEQFQFRKFGELAHELQERLIDEMSASLFMAIDSDRVRFFTEANLFGNEVADKFPSTAFDIEESGKCLALDRGTSCVFHLMRVLEIGLYAMVAQFNITPEENWANAIEQIQSEVNRLAKLHPGNKSPWKEPWKDRVEFYSEAAAQFMYIKEAWRNRAAHAGHTYTIEKARSIFDHVREFMNHLATRLNEWRRPEQWGKRCARYSPS